MHCPLYYGETQGMISMTLPAVCLGSFFAISFNSPSVALQESRREKIRRCISGKMNVISKSWMFEQTKMHCLKKKRSLFFIEQRLNLLSRRTEISRKPDFIMQLKLEYRLCKKNLPKKLWMKPIKVFFFYNIFYYTWVSGKKKDCQSAVLIDAVHFIIWKWERFKPFALVLCGFIYSPSTNSTNKPEARTKVDGIYDFVILLWRRRMAWGQRVHSYLSH